jgi:hypothetical protein
MAGHAFRATCQWTPELDLRINSASFQFVIPSAARDLLFTQQKATSTFMLMAVSTQCVVIRYTTLSSGNASTNSVPSRAASYALPTTW